MSLTRDSLSRVRLYADRKIPFVLPFFVVADSMSLDLTVLARLFAVLKLLYVLIFFIICARLKDLRITYFVATLSPLNMLFPVLTVSRLYTGLIFLGYKTRDIFRIVYLLCKCVELFAVRFSVGNVHIIVSTLVTDLNRLGCVAMILFD